LKRILLAFALLAILIPISVAQAAAVQEFSFQLKNIRPDGRFTVVFTSRTYDSTGGIPPVLRENFLRLPKGAELAREVRNRRYYCDANKLLKDLQANPDPSKRFDSRVANLKPFIGRLRRSRVAADRKALRNAEVCERAHTGRGTAQVDARPLFNELIPAKFFMFFGKGTQRGALGSLQIIGMPDESSAVVKRLPPTVQQTRVPFVLNFFNEPTPDGKYGYKLLFPTGPVAGVNISIAEVNAVTTGLSVKKRKASCVRRRGGRCVRRRVKTTNVFWFTRPTCPPSRKLSFQAFYGYDDPQPDITKTIELSCPNFRG
jgi:hypothetical protein